MVAAWVGSSYRICPDSRHSNPPAAYLSSCNVRDSWASGTVFEIEDYRTSGTTAHGSYARYDREKTLQDSQHDNSSIIELWSIINGIVACESWADFSPVRHRRSPGHKHELKLELCQDVAMVPRVRILSLQASIRNPARYTTKTATPRMNISTCKVDVCVCAGGLCTCPWVPVPCVRQSTNHGTWDA